MEMCISYYIIKDLLSPYVLLSAETAPKNSGFDWVEVFSDELGFCDKGTVYIATWSQIKGLVIPEGYLCVCLIEDFEQEDLPSQANIIFLDNQLSVQEILYLIRKYIRTIQDWDKAMTECILFKDLRKLVTISGEIIGNTILVYDDNFRLLAYYGSNPNDEKHYSSLVKKTISLSGYDNEDTDPSFSNWPDVATDDGDGYDRSEEKLVTRTIFIEKNPKVQVFMVCGKDKATQGKIDLFIRMFEQIELFIVRETPVVQHSKNVDSLLIDLLDNKISNPYSAVIRAEYCNFQLQQFFCLFVVKFKNEYVDIEAIRLLKNIAKQLPTAKLLSYDNHILIINYYDVSTNRSESDKWINAIKDIVRDAQAELGISMPEDNLCNLYLSYKRAIIAIEYGEIVKKNQLFDYSDNIEFYRFKGYDVYPYETFYIYHIIACLSADSKTILESSHCLRALAKLYAFDCRHKMNNLKLLYCYLINERSASKTASIMHMHRNNVIYRIIKIEEMLGISFEEQHYRFKILFSYRIVDFYGLDYLKNIDFSTVGTDVSNRKSPAKK